MSSAIARTKIFLNHGWRFSPFLRSLLYRSILNPYSYLFNLVLFFSKAINLSCMDLWLDLLENRPFFDLAALYLQRSFFLFYICLRLRQYLVIDLLGANSETILLMGWFRILYFPEKWWKEWLEPKNFLNSYNFQYKLPTDLKNKKWTK
jgi:hypothetical protein